MRGPRKVDVSRQDLDYYRAIADRHGNQSLVDKITLELQDHDRELDALLRKYGSYDDEFGVFMIDETYPTYDMFVKERTHMQSINEQIDVELLNECKEELDK